MEKQGIYAYAVVSNSQPRLPSPGTGGQVKMSNVFLVNYKDLTLIGKMINISDFQKDLQEALKNPKAMEAVLTEHQDFLDRLMKETTIIPFQFGTILKNKEGAIDHLKSSYTKYKELLKKFKSREEWGVRVFADLKKFKTSIVQTDRKDTQKSTRLTLLRPFEALRSPQALEEVDTERPSNVSSSGTAYLLGKIQEEEAEKATNEKLTSFSEEILNSLKELALEYKVTKSSQRFSEKGELLISVFAFLLDRYKVKEFDQKLTDLQRKYQQFSLRLVSSGPWPASNFVS